MNYYIDTEFLEGTQDKTILRIKYGKTKPTIDLISIGMVSEDNREYYAISKDFNLKEAWNRYDKVECCKIPIMCGNKIQQNCEGFKRNYWLRENVLKPIYLDLLKIGNIYGDERNYWSFTYRNLKRLLKWYGKTNKQIAEEIKSFTRKVKVENETLVQDNPKFYAYYADYDWVAFCWLFGKMMDLPNGFPMYCIDLKQELENRLKTYTSQDLSKATCPSCKHNVYAAMDYDKPLITMEKCITDHPNYPKQTNEHNALSDAKWNKQLHEFLNQLYL